MEDVWRTSIFRSPRIWLLVSPVWLFFRIIYVCIPVSYVIKWQVGYLFSVAIRNGNLFIHRPALCETRISTVWVQSVDGAVLWIRTRNKTARWAGTLLGEFGHHRSEWHKTALLISMNKNCDEIFEWPWSLWAGVWCLGSTKMSKFISGIFPL